MTLERKMGGEKTLAFRTPEISRSFHESIETRMQSDNISGTRRNREIVGEELAKKFEEEGVGITVISQPWEHSSIEHAEVQQLVSVAFSKSFEEAVREARKSKFFPRNMDLFHDILTGELYNTVLESHMNRVRVSPLVIGSMLGIFMAMLIVIIVFVYTL